MSYALQQIVIPVGVLGAVEDPIGDADAWLTHFASIISAMAESMPCKAWVRLAPDVATRMYGSALQSIDPSETFVLLTQCGSDRASMQVYFDRALPENTVRLE